MLIGYDLKQLGQLRPANTNAASIYTPASGIIAIVTGLWVANLSGADRLFRLFYDHDGTTYNETTAIVWDGSVFGNNWEFVPISNVEGAGLPLTSQGNIAVRTDSANNLNFTLVGFEKKL